MGVPRLSLIGSPRYETLARLARSWSRIPNVFRRVADVLRHRPRDRLKHDSSGGGIMRPVRGNDQKTGPLNDLSWVKKGRASSTTNSHRFTFLKPDR